MGRNKEETVSDRSPLTWASLVCWFVALIWSSVAAWLMTSLEQKYQGRALPEIYRAVDLSFTDDVGRPVLLALTGLIPTVLAGILAYAGTKRGEPAKRMGRWVLILSIVLLNYLVVRYELHTLNSGN